MNRQDYMIKRFLPPARLFPLFICLVGVHSSLLGRASIHYNKKELRQLLQSAKTIDDYELLAGYFLSEESAYRAKTHSDQKNYEQALHTISVPKYPPPADTARWLYQYDFYKADQMAKLAAQYEQKLERINPLREARA